MHPHWVVLDEVFYYSWRIAFDPPHEKSSFFVVADDRILDVEGAQSTDDAYGILDLVAFDFWVDQVESSIFFSPNGRNGSGTWLH